MSKLIQHLFLPVMLFSLSVKTDGTLTVFFSLKENVTKPVSASAVTLTACDLLMIHREDFMPFLEQNPKAAIDLINVLALRLRLNTGQLAEFVIKEATPSLS